VVLCSKGGRERERERALTFERVYQAAPSAHEPSEHADVASTAAAPSSVPKVCVCERECVCAREREKERARNERESETDRQTERERTHRISQQFVP
jgi:hypothetical protein